MKLKDKIKIRRFKKYWKKHGRKDMFSLVHVPDNVPAEQLYEYVLQSSLVAA